MTVYFYKKLKWEDGSDTAQKLMFSLLPLRSMRDVLKSTHIYYDPGEDKSNIDGAPILETRKGRKTPWVITLRFYFEQMIMGEMFKKVKECLENKYRG